MTLIVHCSDLHFGRVDPAVVEALAADIRAARPALVVASGDLTQGARTEEFRAARAFLDALEAPYLAVPGNHDLTPYRLFERFLDPWGRWRQFIGRETEPCWSNEDAIVVGLNSARSHSLSLDWSRGRLNRRQLRLARERLAAAPAGAVRIVTAHHPVLTPDVARRTTIVGRARLALRLFEDSGVDLVLSGHLHRSFVSNVARQVPPDPIALTAHLPKENVALAPVATRGRGMTVLLAASATSTRLRDEANSYHHIRVSGGRFSVERRTWRGMMWEAREVVLPVEAEVAGASALRR